MAQPKVAARSPVQINLEKGEHHWCACGASKAQPFCDGSHKGTEFEPVKFTIAEKTTVWLCGCKRTGNQPSCDGTHSKI